MTTALMEFVAARPGPTAPRPDPVSGDPAHASVELLNAAVAAYKDGAGSLTAKWLEAGRFIHEFLVHWCGRLGRRRAHGVKLAEAKILEAVGTSRDVHALIQGRAIYDLLGGEALAGADRMPWSGYLALLPLVRRAATSADPESNVWAVNPAVDADVARALFRSWVGSQPRMPVAELRDRAEQLLEARPKGRKKQPSGKAEVRDWRATARRSLTEGSLKDRAGLLLELLADAPDLPDLLLTVAQTLDRKSARRVSDSLRSRLSAV